MSSHPRILVIISIPTTSSSNTHRSSLKVCFYFPYFLKYKTYLLFWFWGFRLLVCCVRVLLVPHNLLKLAKIIASKNSLAHLKPPPLSYQVRLLGLSVVLFRSPTNPGFPVSPVSPPTSARGNLTADFPLRGQAPPAATTKPQHRQFP